MTLIKGECFDAYNIAKTGVQLSSDKIDALFEKLYPLTQVEKSKKIQHIKNIEQKKQEITASQNSPTEEKKSTVKERVCPRCGGKLMIRTAAKGNRQGKKFLGCSNYPKCRYIENLLDE